MSKYVHASQAGLHFEADWNNVHLVRMHMDDMAALGVHRNDWVVIVNVETGNRIYRMVRGAAEEGFMPGSIRMDYDGAVELDKPWVRSYYSQFGAKYYQSVPKDTFAETRWAIGKCSTLHKITVQALH